MKKVKVEYNLCAYEHSAICITVTGENRQYKRCSIKKKAIQPVKTMGILQRLCFIYCGEQPEEPVTAR